MTSSLFHAILDHADSCSLPVGLFEVEVHEPSLGLKRGHGRKYGFSVLLAKVFPDLWDVLVVAAKLENGLGRRRLEATYKHLVHPVAPTNGERGIRRHSGYLLLGGIKHVVGAMRLCNIHHRLLPSCEECMIEYCMEQRRRHDLINPTSPITDQNMIELLRIMSIGHKKFESVYTTYQIQQKGGENAKEMSLSTYVALLRAAAQQIDASNGGRSGRRFNANVHDSSLYGDDASHDEQSYEAYVHDLQDTEFDTDTPLHVVQAFQAGQKPTRGSSSSSNFRLPNALFFELSQEGKKAWASIPTSDKGTIIKYFTDNKPSARTSGNGQTTPPRDNQGKFKRSANEHDQSPSVEEKSGPDEDPQEDSGTVQSHHHEVHVSERKQVPEETRVLDLLQKNSTVKDATFGDIRAYLSEKSYIADREIATENKKLEVNVMERVYRKARDVHGQHAAMGLQEPTAVMIHPPNQYTGTTKMELIYGNGWWKTDSDRDDTDTTDEGLEDTIGTQRTKLEVNMATLSKLSSLMLDDSDSDEDSDTKNSNDIDRKTGKKVSENKVSRANILRHKPKKKPDIPRASLDLLRELQEEEDMLDENGLRVALIAGNSLQDKQYDEQASVTQGFQTIEDMGLVQSEEGVHDEPKAEHPYPDIGTGGTQAHEGWNQSLARLKNDVARTVHESRDKMERIHVEQARRDTQKVYEQRAASFYEAVDRMEGSPILQRMIAAVRANAIQIALGPDDVIANLLNQPYRDSILFMGFEETLAKYRRDNEVYEDLSEGPDDKDEEDPDMDEQGGSEDRPGEEEPKGSEEEPEPKPSEESKEQEPDGESKEGKVNDDGSRPMTRQKVADEGLKIVKKTTKAGKDTEFQVRNKDSDSSKGKRLSPSSQGSEQSYASALKKSEADARRPVQSPLPKASSGNGKPKKGQQPNNKFKSMQEKIKDKLSRNQNPFQGSEHGQGWIVNKKKKNKKSQGQGTTHGGHGQPKG